MASSAADLGSCPRARTPGPRPTRIEARRQLLYELASGASGLVLAVFVWGTPHPATHRNALATGMSQPRELLQIQT